MQFTTPINIGVDTTLKFFAMDNADNAEVINTESYTFTDSASLAIDVSVLSSPVLTQWMQVSFRTHVIWSI